MRSEAQIGSKIISLQNQYEQSEDKGNFKGVSDQYIHGWIEALEWSLGKAKCSVCNAKLLE
jgi:hypothetical protein